MWLGSLSLSHQSRSPDMDTGMSILMSCMLRPARIEPQGAIHQALTFFKGVAFITWHLRDPFLAEYQWSHGIFGECCMCQGCRPAPGSTFKKPLCHTCALGGALNKYQQPASQIPRKPTNHPSNHPTSQPTNQPVNYSTNQALNQVPCHLSNQPTK